MRRDFLIALAPTDDLKSWEAQWMISTQEPGKPMSTGNITKATFTKKIDAVKWLDQETTANGFTSMTPQDLETRVFVSVALLHGN